MVTLVGSTGTLAYLSVSLSHVNDTLVLTPFNFSSPEQLHRTEKICLN